MIRFVSKNIFSPIGLVLLMLAACVKSEIIADGTSLQQVRQKDYPVANVSVTVYQQNGNEIRGHNFVSPILSERLTKCYKEKSPRMATPIALFGVLKINENGEVSSVQLESQAELLPATFLCTDNILKQAKFAEPAGGSDNYMVYIRVNLDMKSAL